jgi:hypothetical protein
MKILDERIEKSADKIQNISKVSQIISESN